jgi:hypothetical protein
VTIWGEIFLGVIAAATLAIAIVMVGALIAAGRLARRVGRTLDQLDVELKPIFEHLNAIARDAARAATMASAQLERVDRAFNDLALRVDQTFRGFQSALGGPVREGQAVLSAFVAALRAIRRGKGPHGRSEEEDALFI